MSGRNLMRACAGLGCVATAALGDGGVPIASVRRDAATFTLLVSPAAPTVGPVEFTLLGPDAAAARLRLVETDEAPQQMAFATVPGLPGAVARTTLDLAGACRFEVRLPQDTSPLLEGELRVQPAPPAWSARWPWLFAWVAPAMLLALRAVAERARGVSYTRNSTRCATRA